MSKLIDAEKLKAEIERRIKHIDATVNHSLNDYESDMVGSECAMVRRETLSSILDYLDTLHEEKQEDLGVELTKWRHEHFDGKRDNDASGEYLTRNSQLALAQHFYNLGLNSKQEDCPKIKGWVARDKNNQLFLYAKKPIYNFDWGFWTEGGRVNELDSALFPEITWLSTPQEVELILKKI